MHLEVCAKVGHRSGWLCMHPPPPPQFRKPQTWVEVSLVDDGQLAWLALPQFPYLESEVQVAVLSTGEVKIQTHPVCGRSLRHTQSSMPLRFF